MLIPIPYSKSWQGEVYQTGTVNDQKLDQKSGLTKVKPDEWGWRRPTDYSRTIWDQFSQATSVSCTASGKRAPCAFSTVFTDGYAGGVLTGDSTVPSFPPSLENSAIIKARLKLKNETVNLSENFATRAQTAEMIATTCGSLAEGIRAAKRLDVRGVQRALGLSRKQILHDGDPFKLWLSHRYGWQPMLGDVHNAVSAISDQYQNGSRGKVTVKGTASSSSNIDVGFSCSANAVQWNFKKYGTVKQSCLVRLDYIEGDGPAGVGLRTASQFGLLNPFELAWELLPGSFIADWFIPIGDFLSQLDADLGYVFKGGSISEKTTVKRTIRYEGCTGLTACAPPTIYSHSASISYPKSRQMTFTRSTYGTSPLPSLPDLTKFRKTSSVHAANGIALLAVNAKGLVNLAENLASAFSGRHHYTQ